MAGGTGGTPANQQSSQTGTSPFVQQMTAGKQTSPLQQMGLEAIMSNFMNMAQPQGAQPVQRGLMPTYQSSALQYKPDYAAIQHNLTRVQPSVQEQQRLAAIEEARIRAEQDAYNAAHPQSNPYDYGGGG